MIYLDNSATTRTLPEAAEAAMAAMTGDFFNPAAAYAYGARTEKRVNEARTVIARPLKAKREEIIFTSGGTESNNAAIFGSLKGWRGPKRVITTAVEHPSVFEAVQSLQQSGDVDIVILPVNEQGYPDMNALIAGHLPEEMEVLRAAAEAFDMHASAADAAENTETETDSENGRGLCVGRDVKILSPIPVPLQDVICLGLNYTEHAEEAAAYAKEAFTSKDRYPVYFAKRVNHSPADGDPVPAYADLVDSLDYEAELAVIIGKDVKGISPEDVPGCIFGYTILNDFSARNLQTRHTQWYLGKSLDGYTPMGPCIVTADEFSFPPRLRISSRVNGELRQDSTTDMLIFGIDHIISELSRAMTLKAGTIISTGTPKGVGMGFDPPKFLHAGDTVTCEIEGIGTLTNTISD